MSTVLGLAVVVAVFAAFAVFSHRESKRNWDVSVLGPYPVSGREAFRIWWTTLAGGAALMLALWLVTRVAS